ncbi:5282_t:CDS:10 [Paraglomus brasilianum]|uniref:5282_t:CDS:1 n=1 Tax=Paraglomus brasilianum TaxID=144538 RepID=A0A9N8WD37_9GLOM|nr:5282_t:CDS:10 [Paraglomus brasilianum]
MILHFLLLVVGVLLAPASKAALQPARFPSNALHNVDVGLNNIDGTVAAFADFNSDKFTDILVLSADQQHVNVYIWDHAKGQFIKSPSATIAIEPNDFTITNVLPGDFNYDGNLDVLVMGPNKKNDDELILRVYLGDGESQFNTTYLEVPSAMSPQPIPFDFSGNMTTDLLGYRYDNNPDKKLTLWKNIYNPESDVLFEVSDLPVDDTACELADPHSNAFIDLNGDCLSDLFLTCQDEDGGKSFQIWINDKEKGFVLSKNEGKLPEGTGQISFADLDGDGTIDMIFPVCSKSSCEIHTAYNRQIPLCTDKKDTNCRQAAQLCAADDAFTFDLKQSPDNDAYVVIPTDSLLDGGMIVTDDDEFNGVLPVPIRIGDYNLDGYPDLLIISSTGGNSYVSLLRSDPCPNEKSECHPSAQRRTFVKVKEGAEDLRAIENAKQAAFFDLDEDGTLDIIVLGSSGSGNAAREVHAIQNNYFNDAFFVKTLVLNGVEKKQNFGVNYPGAAFKFTVLDTSGKKRANQVAQYSQAGYISMQTPYSLFGLGRTNNYVEELFVGTTRNQTNHYSTFSGVIPNSQLIIIPYQPSDVENPSTWTLELYIHPGDWVPWVLITLIAATGVLALVVFTLNWMEKREDELEKRKALHVINFDAL